MALNKGDHKLGEIEITQENIEFSNQYATLYNDDVIFPNGSNGKYLRFVWKAPYGVMIFASTNDGSIVLIKTYRHENRAWSLEVPKGFGEVDLSPLECAQKELKEETGLTANKWQLFKTLNEKSYPTYIFLAKLDNLHSNLSKQENSEAISEVKIIPKRSLPELLHNELVFDPITLFFISYSMLTDE
ncbi:NUDIX hydrolase [Gayadomonas joobiniege]|uniref:NUDIX hydrolase n=1 Tax=Gayadomonas joobiniege TaxID=1234606 RepID=UPI00036D7360|nr:NUDIX hydrolase [Gayadomonas joobiniege]